MIKTHDDFNSFVIDVTEEQLEAYKYSFQKNDEFILIPEFISRGILTRMLLDSERCKEDAHRSFIPKHKKGGSVPRPILKKKSPVLSSLYESREILYFFNQLTGQDLNLCPDHDLHACALYLYTEEGDHIDYHFDTSYYKGARYTALLGILNRSECLLEYELFHKQEGQDIVKDASPVEPGTLVFFNGDKVRHRVTPAGVGDERIVLTLEYVTDSEMSLTTKFVSNMKDAIAYFGFRSVFGTKDV